MYKRQVDNIQLIFNGPCIMNRPDFGKASVCESLPQVREKRDFGKFIREVPVPEPDKAIFLCNPVRMDMISVGNRHAAAVCRYKDNLARRIIGESMERAANGIMLYFPCAKGSTPMAALVIDAVDAPVLTSPQYQFLSKPCYSDRFIAFDFPGIQYPVPQIFNHKITPCQKLTHMQRTRPCFPYNLQK